VAMSGCLTFKDKKRLNIAHVEVVAFPYVKYPFPNGRIDGGVTQVYWNQHRDRCRVLIFLVRQD